MIKISRHYPAPPWFDSDTVRDARSAIETIVTSCGRAKSEDFKPHWNKDDVRKCLWEMQYHKCCYCERMRDLKRESDIEHYRPKAEVHGDGNHPGYWWLAYNWENLFFSCRMCNQDFKKNYFPVLSGSSRATDPNQPLEGTTRLLLDPCNDDPEKEFVWVVRQVEEFNTVTKAKISLDTTTFAFAHGTTDRGMTTEATLGLNRGTLLEERGVISQIMQAIIQKAHAGKHFGNQMILDAAIADIRQQTAPDKPFLGLRRFLIRQANLGEYLHSGVDVPVVSSTATAPTISEAIAPVKKARSGRTKKTQKGIPSTGGETDATKKNAAPRRKKAL